MLATFYNWSDAPGYLIPEKAVLHLDYSEYQIIMRALKKYAVENDVYTEIADIVTLVSEIEHWYKFERHLKEKDKE